MLPSFKASTKAAMPRTSGHASLPRRRSAIGISRTTSAPLFLRTTAEKQCGERIITPSISAWPPIYGRATPSGPTTAGWFDIVLSIALRRAPVAVWVWAQRECFGGAVWGRGAGEKPPGEGSSGGVQSRRPKRCSLAGSCGRARVTTTETVDATLGVHHALLAGVVRVASRTDIDLK